MRRIVGRGSVRPSLPWTAENQLNKLMDPVAQGTDPAQTYFAVGACNQLVDSLQLSVHQLERRLNQQHDQGCITIEQGPYAGDPDAAVALATESLRQARTASREMQTALERAHMALADIADPKRRRQ